MERKRKTLSIRVKGKAEEPTKSVPTSRRRQPWNGDVHDLGQMKATKREIERRKSLHVSRNAESAREELREKLAVMRGELEDDDGADGDDDVIVEEIASALDALRQLIDRKSEARVEPTHESGEEDHGSDEFEDPMAKHLQSSPVHQKKVVGVVDPREELRAFEEQRKREQAKTKQQQQPPATPTVQVVSVRNRSPIDEVSDDRAFQQQTPISSSRPTPRTMELVGKLTKKNARLELMLREKDEQLQAEVSARQSLWEELQVARSALESREREIEALRRHCKELAASHGRPERQPPGRK